MRPLALAAAALLLAGCSASEGPSIVEQAADALDGGPSPEELARMPGRIAGVVTDESLTPVAGATLTLLRENVSVTSDAAGAFRFENLPAGSYLLQGRAAEHETRTVAVPVRNATTMEVNLTLPYRPTPEPHHETAELAGFLSCGARYALPDGAEDGVDCGSADPNHQDAFEARVGEGGRNVVIELSYDPEESPGARRLALHAETVGYGALDQDLGSAEGEGYARLVVPRDVMEKFYVEGGLVRVEVRMLPSATQPAVALQQRFTVYVTTFYVEEGPADFRVAP
ncbi:MAG TPA: carboxypeptidase-like regulatory domain-containing protein [Candidatus Thermoplasmatota archaeon]|nr:carboxypeptidase-like regulatory domain-containing protein [Candidatus Thermoplasmatota archaeon]